MVTYGENHLTDDSRSQTSSKGSIIGARQNMAYNPMTAEVWPSIPDRPGIDTNNQTGMTMGNDIYTQNGIRLDMNPMDISNYMNMGGFATTMPKELQARYQAELQSDFRTHNAQIMANYDMMPDTNMNNSFPLNFDRPYENTNVDVGFQNEINYNAKPVNGDQIVPQVPIIPQNEANQSNEFHNIYIKGEQPVFPVPMHQQVYRQDQYRMVPKIELYDSVIPTVYNQTATHQIPDITVEQNEFPVEITKTREKYVTVEEPIITGYKPRMVSTWDTRQVPRPIPKYVGKQDTINVEVPQIVFKDKMVEKQVVVAYKETIEPITKEIEQEKTVVQYEWQPQQQQIPVYKCVPKIDIALDCPPPILVPYPQQKIIREETKSQLEEPTEERSEPDHGNQSRKSSLWDWFSFRKKNEKPQTNLVKHKTDSNSPYPEHLPDFTDYFKNNYTPTQSKQECTDNIQIPARKPIQAKHNPIEPEINYRGSINKPPIHAGDLEGISFKLHAIEVHQLIRLPNLPLPEFINRMPQKFALSDMADYDNMINPLQTPAEFVEATGIPAPTIGEIARGEISPDWPLFAIGQ